MLESKVEYYTVLYWMSNAINLGCCQLMNTFLALSPHLETVVFDICGNDQVVVVILAN